MHSELVADAEEHRPAYQENDANEDAQAGPDDLDARLGGELFAAQRATLPRGLGLDRQNVRERVATLFGLHDGADELANDVGRRAIGELKERLFAGLAEVQLLQHVAELTHEMLA